MTPFTPLVTTLLVLAAPGPADPPASLEIERTNSRSEAGFRFGIGSGVAAGAAYGCGSDPCTGVFGLIFGLDFGYQFSRDFALTVRPEVATSLLSNYANASMSLEHTPLPRFSFAVGAGAEVIGNAFVGEGYYGAVFPIRVHLNFLDDPTWEGRARNSTWRIGLDVVPGVGRLLDRQGTLGTIRGALTSATPGCEFYRSPCFLASRGGRVGQGDASWITRNS